MMGLLERERETYEAAWSIGGYAVHSPGESFLPAFRAMSDASTTDQVLDAGCGSGKGALALRAAGFVDVRLCDLTDFGLVDEARAFRFSRACLWEPLPPQFGYLFGGSFDWVYCCDVLEHIPPQFTMLTVARLLEVARKGVFLSISLVPDAFGAWVGKPLHQTVQSYVQWRDQLSELGTVRESRDLLNVGLYLVEPR